MALSIFFLALFSLFRQTIAISQQGSVGLWSDSECNSKSGQTSNFGEQDPIALNFTLLPDVCGVPGATVHSYRVLQNATCANGTTAMFDYYNSSNCTADPTDEDPNPGVAKLMKHRRQLNSVLNGECLALIAFNSLAFICEGISPRSVQTNSFLTSKSSSTVASTSSALISTSSSNHSAIATSSPANHSSATIVLGATSSATISSVRTSATTSDLGSKSRLPTGASAGIGVGSAFGVLAVAALIFCFFRRYKVVKIKDGNGNPGPASADPAMASLSGRGGIIHEVGPPSVHETGPGQPHEVGGDGANTVHEAGTDNEIHEIANPRMDFDS